MRAIAVLSVFLYHLNIPLVSGGFVGVDVFFVISGFLITSILVSELQSSTFSLAGFYERRVRRIAPALFAIFAVVTIASYLYLLPGEFIDYAKSLFAALFSCSNFFFWHQAGYFDAPSSAKPLLHTWSLAVEEQFYLAFPLLLALIYRFFRRHLLAILLTLAVASLALSAWATPRDPNFAFYWPLTRAWELLLGSLIAIAELPILRHRLTRNLASACGLLMILFAVFRYTSHTAFPGTAAILPVFGAALVIASGAHGTTAVGRILSLKPLVFTGLISYSLYLWHWPIIVLHGHGMPLTGGAIRFYSKLILLAIAYALAALSWRFVERPFRRARGNTPRRTVFLAALAAALVTVCVAGVILVKHGFPSRFSARAQGIASYMDQPEVRDARSYRAGACFLNGLDRMADFQEAACLPSAPHPSTLLLLGDSHAGQLYYGLSTVFTDFNVQQATAAGCKPTLKQGRDRRPACTELMTHILRDYLPSHPGSHVLLAARWGSEDLGRLGDTVSYLKSIGSVPVVVGPIMEYDAPLPLLLALSIKDNDPHLIREHRNEGLRSLDATMSKLAANRWGVKYLSYYKYFCPAADCVEFVSNDVPFQRDQEHLTEPASVLVANAWKDAKQLP